ncbi:MAG: CHAT domain-containing protein [Cytophagales bacterium]|nr:MAG: CHAT domain-containing protein [Cytophagales bacterium]
MKHFYNFLLVAFISTLLSHPIYAKEFDFNTQFNKVGIFISTGDMKNAKKYHTLLLDQTYKKFGAEHFYYAAVKFQEARIHNGLGNFPAYLSAVEQGAKVLSLNKGSEDEYLFAVVQGAQAYLDYKNPKKASELISKAIDWLEKGKIDASPIVSELRWVYAQVLAAQGFYKKSRTVLQDASANKYLQIVNTVEIKDPKTGKLKMKKLSSKEIAQLKRNYAETLHLGVGLLIEMGDEMAADSMTKTTDFWIKQQLGASDFSIIKNYYHQGLIYENNQNVKLEYQSFNKALELLKTSKGLKYSTTSVMASLIYEKAILSAKKISKFKEATKIQINYTASWKRTYNKDNFYRSQIDLLEANRQVIEEDYEQAEKELRQLNSSNSVIPNTHLGRIKVLSLLNNIYEHQDAYDEVEKNLLEIIRINKELVGENTPLYHLSQLNLADFYVLYSSKLKVAEDIYKLSLDNIVSKELDYKSNKYLNKKYLQSKLYQITDRFTLSQNILNGLSDKIKVRYGLNHPIYAEVQEKLAALDIELGRYNEAQQKLESSINILKSRMNEIDVAAQYQEALETLALLQMINGEYAASRKTLSQAQKTIRKKSSAKEQKSSVASEELAYLNIYTGQYQGTEKQLKESIAIREKRFGNKSRTLITPYNQLGELYLITGDFTDAEQMVRKSAVISKAIFGDSSLKYAESLTLLTKIFTSLGDYAKAEEAIRTVLQIQKQKYGDNNFHIAQSLNTLALVRYYNKGSQTDIEQNFKESISLINKTLGNKNPEYAEVQKNLALFYIETKRIKEAPPLLENAFQIYKEKFGKDNIHLAEILTLQGNLNYFNGSYLEAKNKYSEAGAVYLKIFDNEHPNYIKTLSLVGQMNFILGDYKSAIKNYETTTTNYLQFIKRFFPALSEREKTKYWNLIKNDFEFYNTLAVNAQKDNPALIGNMYNFALNTKAILLNSSIKVKERILASKDLILITKYENFVANKELMASAISMSSEERKNSNIDIKTLEKEIESMEKELSSSSELFIPDNENNNLYEWEKIKDALKPNEVAVEMIRYRKFTTTFTDSIKYAALIITPETKSQPNLVLFENGKELETRNIKFYRNAIKLKLDDQISYQAFWSPLKKYIKENTTVYFSPDGVYNQLNIETLLSSDGKVILDHHEVIMTSSTRDLLKKKVSVKKKDQATAVNQIALFGNPNYYPTQIQTPKTEENTSQNIEQLLGAEKEVREIYQLLKKSGWNTKLLLNNDAEEDSVKKLVNPKIFHIATHGFFMQDAQTKSITSGLNDDQLYNNPLLKSGLLLKNGGTLMAESNVYDFNSEDGILTAYEAMNLNFDKTDLVVLSACETGLGEVQVGEGVYGLQRAFLVAGAQSIIMSLFKVNDEVTQELMMSFYARLLKTNDRRKSFLEAKKEIKSKYKDPIFWGSFVMIGLN